ncbi:MAG: hypothetical protein WCK77_12115 [Verrucomicrobiota bacterium]
MSLKTFITLFLGLAFQLAQVLPGGVIPPPTAPAAKSCQCCAGSKSCCCAKNELPAPKPAQSPLLPAGLLKGMAIKTAETTVSAEFWYSTGPAATLAVAQATTPHAGFAGVRLAVAFCSFVI